VVDELMAALGGALLFTTLALLVVVVDLLRSHGRVLRTLHELGAGEPEPGAEGAPRGADES
jgi:hypothetical protein